MDQEYIQVQPVNREHGRAEHEQPDHDSIEPGTHDGGHLTVIVAATSLPDQRRGSLTNP